MIWEKSKYLDKTDHRPAHRRDCQEEFLANCYYNSLKACIGKRITSTAFPSISTGVYHFPVQLAAKIAVRTVSRFMQEEETSY